MLFLQSAQVHDANGYRQKFNGGRYQYLKKLLSNLEDRVERYNPFTALSREEIIQQLALARKHAEEGKVKDAHQASANVRTKYGLI